MTIEDRLELVIYLVSVISLVVGFLIGRFSK